VRPAKNRGMGQAYFLSLLSAKDKCGITAAGRGPGLFSDCLLEALITPCSNAMLHSSMGMCITALFEFGQYV
jgi:hypothetical protein